MDKIRNNSIVKRIGFNTIVLLVVLVLLFALFAILTPIVKPNTTFLSYSRIVGIFNYAYFLGFLALGVSFVIETGGIDFSVGPVMFCSALIAGQLLTRSNWPIGVCLLVSILVGAAFGTFNGILVAYGGLPSFITSMASMMIAKGVGSVFTRTQSVSWPGGWYKNLISWKVGGVTIPTGIIILLLGFIICSVFIHRTRPGRYILCIGSNREAVRLSGVNTKKWEMLAYILSGAMAGIAAIFYVGVYTTVLPGGGDTFNNDAIASCVMGGTSMAGGIASVGGTLIGVIIISLLQVGILAMGFQSQYQYVITGLIVLVVVWADLRSRRRRN